MADLDTYGFVETAYAYPTTHMVAPKEDALGCADCHAPAGRLAALSGFYMPGRDRSPFIDAPGWAGVGGAALGVFIHGLLRIVSRRRRREFA